MKRMNALICSLLIAAMVSTSVTPIHAADGWNEQNGTWTYTKEDGTLAKGWMKEGNCWYFFDENGKMAASQWLASSEHWYWFGGSGVMQQNTIVEDAYGNIYFVKNTGVMARNYVKGGLEFGEDGIGRPLSESQSVLIDSLDDLNGLETVEGNLYIAENVAEDLKLENIKVNGKLVILASDTTVTLKDVQSETVYVQATGTKVVLEGKTAVNEVILERGATVTADKKYHGKVDKVEIQSTATESVVIDVEAKEVSVRTYSEVTINEPAEKINVITDSSKVNINADVEEIIINSSAKDSTITIGEDYTVGNIEANAPVDIKGEGTVDKIEVNVDGVTADKDLTIKDVDAAKGVTDVPKADKPVSGGGSSGGNGGGVKPDTKKYTVTFESEGVQLSSVKVEKGKTVSEPVEPTKEGYKFLGWFNGNEKYDFSAPVTGDLILVAHWEEMVAKATNFEELKTYLKNYQTVELGNDIVIDEAYTLAEGKTIVIPQGIKLDVKAQFTVEGTIENAGDLSVGILENEIQMFEEKEVGALINFTETSNLITDTNTTEGSLHFASLDVIQREGKDIPITKNTKIYIGTYSKTTALVGPDKDIFQISFKETDSVKDRLAFFSLNGDGVLVLPVQAKAQVNDNEPNSIKVKFIINKDGELSVPNLDVLTPTDLANDNNSEEYTEEGVISTHAGSKVYVGDRLYIGTLADKEENPVFICDPQNNSQVFYEQGVQLRRIINSEDKDKRNHLAAWITGNVELKDSFDGTISPRTDEETSLYVNFEENQFTENPFITDNDKRWSNVLTIENNTKYIINTNSNYWEKLSSDLNKCSITLSGYLQVGKLISADVEKYDGDVNELDYKWYCEGKVEPFGDTKEIKIPEDAAGNKIYVIVSAGDNNLKSESVTVVGGEDKDIECTNESELLLAMNSGLNANIAEKVEIAISSNFVVPKESKLNIQGKLTFTNRVDIEVHGQVNMKGNSSIEVLKDIRVYFDFYNTSILNIGNEKISASTNDKDGNAYSLRFSKNGDNIIYSTLFVYNNSSVNLTSHTILDAIDGIDIFDLTNSVIIGDEVIYNADDSGLIAIEEKTGSEGFWIGKVEMLDQSYGYVIKLISSDIVLNGMVNRISANKDNPNTTVKFNYDTKNGEFVPEGFSGAMKGDVYKRKSDNTGWEKVVESVTEYTVSFDAAEPVTVKVEEGNTVAEPATPEKVGFTFLGWFVGDVKYDFTTPVTEDLTLTARFEEITADADVINFEELHSAVQI